MGAIKVSKEQLEFWLEHDMIVDGVPGGLVLGNRHKEGGILMLCRFREGVYIIGEMEGGEYLVNHFACDKNLARIKGMLQYKGDPEPNLEPYRYDNFRHYNIPSGHLILVGYPYAIISRAGTRKFLEELDLINESTITPELFPYLFKDK